MAALVVRRRAHLLPASEPNVIPFIDVLLVLLIIFMVTAPKPTTDLRVDLPAPGHAIIHALAPTIVAIRLVGGDVRIYVDNEEVSGETLPGRALAHLQAANPSLTAGMRWRTRIFLCAPIWMWLTIAWSMLWTPLNGRSSSTSRLRRNKREAPQYA